MPENFDILKYQFPPPGSAMLNVGSSEYAYILGNNRFNVLWKMEIPEGAALVLSSVTMAITNVVAAIKGTPANLTDFRNRARAFLHYALIEDDFLALTPGHFEYLKWTGAYAARAAKKISLARPLPIYTEDYASGNGKGPVAFFPGPIVIGGPRWIALSVWARYLAGADNADCGYAQAGALGWTLPDPEKVWKDSFR